MSTDEEVDRLFHILNSEEIQRAFWQSGLDQFSAESKNELMNRIAATFEPPPRGALLGRLLLIANEENKPALITALLANLHSPDPEARKASLYGLEKLEHPSFIDFAISALRDSDDQVVTAACTILLPKAKQDPRIWKILEQVYEAHKDQPEFHMSMSFLKSHSVGS
jgi:hypothetical protein